MLKLILKTLLLPLAILLAAGYFILFTHSGLNVAINTIKQVTPGKLDIQQFTGENISKFNLQNINYNWEDYNIHIDQLNINWRAPFIQLKATNLRINDFIFSSATTQIKPGKLFCADFQLQNGSTNLKIYDLPLSRLEIKGSINPKLKIKFNGNLNLAEHQLDFNGITETNNKSTKLNISAKQLEIINNSEYKLIISPKLNIQITNDKLQINGEVFIPSAHILPLDFSTTTELPSEVNFVGKPKSTNITDSIEANLNITLGDDVKISTQGLSGQLSGNLSLQQTPKKPLTANGELKLLNGSYKLYGRKLTVKHGSLNFAGGIIYNPYLNFQASRQLSDAQHTTLGVIVSGELNNPKLKLFSQPVNLAQSEILSLMLFNQSLKDIKQDDAGLLLNLLSAFNDQIPLNKKISQRFGLDDIDINTHGSPTLTLQKALSSRLLVKYTAGLLERTHKLALHYKFNKMWAVKTTTDGESSAVDVLYTIEK